jgi:predicted esterase
MFGQSRRIFIVALWLASASSCGRHRLEVAPSAQLDAGTTVARGPWSEMASPSDGDANVTKTAFSPLQAESWLVELHVDGYRDARVSVPLGAKEPRPVVVALHGAGDRPEWACGGWRGVTDAYPFVVCPTGDPGGLPGGFVWGNDAAVEREVSAAVEATRAHFGKYVALGCTLVAGFSQGAIRMPPILTRGGNWCPEAVLCEGAYDALDARFARAFSGAAGRRLLLGCSQPYCARVFGQREALLRRAGIDVRTVYSGGRTHNLDGEMVSTLRKAWPWLVRDDVRWALYLDASDP